MLLIQPDLVQVISWNDFGESHYISDIGLDSQAIEHAKPYVADFPHSSFRAILSYYITAYKEEKKTVPLPKSLGGGAVMVWYGTTSVNVSDCHDGGAVWGQYGTMSAKAGVEADSVNLLAVVRKNSTFTIRVGNMVSMCNGYDKLHWAPLQQYSPASGRNGENITILLLLDPPSDFAAKRFSSQLPSTNVRNLSATQDPFNPPNWSITPPRNFLVLMSILSDKRFTPHELHRLCERCDAIFSGSVKYG